MFNDILIAISAVSDKNFDEASEMLEECVNEDANFIDILSQIGTIPEYISHDSTEEKLFSKVSDATLARAFREIGLKATVLKERGDSADVLAESPIYGYTLVADAKAFRMSRTVKNQKDFKVTALSSWRKNSDFAVLCSPYFQYPFRMSQIYDQALNNNVCLLSWEHLILMIKNDIKESKNLNLSPIWEFCDKYFDKVPHSNMKKCFIRDFNKVLLDVLHLDGRQLDEVLNNQIKETIERGKREKLFWSNEIAEIKKYSKEEAINELIKAKKINEKIAQINSYTGGLQN